MKLIHVSSMRLETLQNIFIFSGKIYGFFQNIGSKIKNAFGCVKDAIFGWIFINVIWQFFCWINFLCCLSHLFAICFINISIWHSWHNQKHSWSCFQCFGRNNKSFLKNKIYFVEFPASCISFYLTANIFESGPMPTPWFF